ncbi:MAG: DUF1512 family protein [Promethearchaeota archaeon]
MTNFDQILSLISSILLVILIFYLLFGQNWQIWRATRQIKQALKDLEKWRNYGVKQLIQIISPLSSESITEQEIKEFISEMLEFFVIAPSEIDSNIYQKTKSLLSQRKKRYFELLRTFLQKIREPELLQIVALLLTTTEIDLILKNVQHNLTIGKKTNGYWFILQTASDISKNMLKAQTYRIALDTLTLNKPIGDSIGPLAVKEFVSRVNPEFDFESENFLVIDNQFYCQKIEFEERILYCLRAKGPEIRTGNPGKVISYVLESIIPKKSLVKMIITIDAYSKLEIEKSGTIAQGLGVVVGSEKTQNLDKYEIETIAINQEPKIKLEAIICREALEEAMLPMSDEIKNSIPRIIRILKQMIRSQTKSKEIIIIMGIGNSIGIIR